MERNLRLYPAYATAFSAHFWLPVFFLFLQSHLSVPQVLRLEALYYFTVVLAEVPSGYFSDAVGRRITLTIAAATISLAHVCFVFGDGFHVFAVGQVFLATGMAFNSGTNTALHFDTLARLDRKSEFDGREARVSRLTFLGSGIAALLGGLVAMANLRYAYALALAGGLVALALALAMKEPHLPSERPIAERAPAGNRVVAALGELRQPALRWLSAYGVAMIVLNHIPYEFYQPYLAQLTHGPALLADTTPLNSGVVTLITMLIASQVAGRSIAIRDRLGLVPTLLLGAGIQVVIIAAMALVIHPLVVLLILLRSCPRALMTAPRNAAVNPLIHEDHRATFLSLESLAGRLAFSGTLLALSVVGDGSDNLRPILTTASFIAVVFLIALASFARSATKKPL